MPNMATAVTAIYRYPVKGLSAEKMDRVALMPGECLPHDRRFAIALGSTPFDQGRPRWLSKTHFIMLMSDEKLAQVQTRFDVEKGVLTIADNGRVLLLARMTEPEGCRLVAEFFANFLEATRSTDRCASSKHQGTPLPMRGARGMRRVWFVLVNQINQLLLFLGGSKRLGLADWLARGGV